EVPLEALALDRLCEDEELKNNHTHVKIGLDHDLSPGLGLPARAGRRVDEVADAADVEHDAVRRAHDDLPAKPRDHAVRLSVRSDDPARPGWPAGLRRS